MALSLDQERDSFLRECVKAAGLGGILIWYPEDIVMATGLWPCLGMNLCLYPVDGTPHYFSPANEPSDVVPDFAESHRFVLGPGWLDTVAALLRDTCRGLGLNTADLGIAPDEGGHAVTSFPGESPPLTHSFVTQSLLGGNGQAGPGIAAELFTALTAKKTTAEQARVKRANDAACIGLRAFYDAAKPGASEVEIAASVEYAIHRASGTEGIGLARGWAHVQGGENIYWGGTYSRSSGNRLTAGDMVIIELATCVDGYWSDLTRTTGVGTLGTDQKDLLGAVQDAQHAAMDAIRAGATHADPYNAARASFAQQGLAEGFPHNAGHHVGFRYHDRGPMLLPDNHQPLEAGMVLTVEPGTYGRELAGGARFEDNVLVTDSGIEILSCDDLQPY